MEFPGGLVKNGGLISQKMVDLMDVMDFMVSMDWFSEVNILIGKWLDCPVKKGVFPANAPFNQSIDG